MQRGVAKKELGAAGRILIHAPLGGRPTRDESTRSAHLTIPNNDLTT